MPKNFFQSYSECINYLFNLERRGIKYDLKNITALLEFLGNPQDSFKSIHVAGTNGKGSVCAMINSYLIENKFRTGLYTSPHIEDFRERILIDGKFVSKKFIFEFTQAMLPAIRKIKPSFFEVTTAMAFEYFRRRKVEYAVIETGLGGRLDSTNIIKPILTIITTIAIDHVEFLGGTLAKIAKEKGGIIKNNVPVIIGNVASGLRKSFKETANKKNAKLISARKAGRLNIVERSENGVKFSVNNLPGEFFLPVPGDYQLSNLRILLAAARTLNKSEGIDFKSSEFNRALLNISINSHFKGRFEKLSEHPKIILDVSHNLQAIKNIRANLKYFKYRNLMIIFGMMHDKNFAACLSELGKYKCEIVLTKPEYKRSARPDKLLESVSKRRKFFIVRDRLPLALDYALKKSGRNDLILITGSFFLAGDFLKIWKRKLQRGRLVH